MTIPLRVTQVSVLADRLRREPEALLAAWFTLPDVASAVARAGAEVTVVQATARDTELVRDGVCYRFARSPAPSRVRRALGPGRHRSRRDWSRRSWTLAPT